MGHLASLAMAAVVALLSVHASASPSFSTGYVGNAMGMEGRYQVFEFTDGGMPLKPVSGNLTVAWPSGLVDGARKTVYAVEHSGGKWSHVRRWTSLDDGAYVGGEVVFPAGPSEPFGIGPATLTYDGQTYRLYYLIRGPNGPGQHIGLATSVDGTQFTRVGVVFSAGANAPGGVSVSYACSHDGESYLLLHGYSSDLQIANSILASAESPDGPYSFETVLFAPSLSNGVITGSAGNQFATFTGSMPLGVPIVVNDPTGTIVYVPREIRGSIVYLDRPLVRTMNSVPWRDHLSLKADVSFIAYRDNGWIGAVTGYGQFPGRTSEYTSPIRSIEPEGPWTTGHGFFLSPYFNSGMFSTENPEPFRSSDSCRLD